MKKKLLTVLALSSLLFLNPLSSKASEELIESTTEYSILSSETTVLESSIEETKESEAVLFSDTEPIYTTDTTEVPESSSELVEESINQYVSLKTEKAIIYQTKEFLEVIEHEFVFGQTFVAKEKLTNTETQKVYYSLYNHEDALIGYIEVSDVDLANNKGGVKQEFIQYGTILKNEGQLLANFEGEIKAPVSNVYKSTVLIKEKYHHFDDGIYYSIYDNKDNWLGYIREDTINLTGQNKQGAHQATNQYAIIKSGNYSIWQNFSWKKKYDSKQFLNRTFKVQGEYHHFNGDIYYSLYDSNGKWYGYINKNATKLTKEAQGEYVSLWKYVTVKNGNQSTWNSFNWNKRYNQKELSGQTLLAKGAYYHANGNDYYSLYDKNNKWYGYINKNFVSVGQGKQGAYQSFGKYVTVTNGNYETWQNFNWKQRSTTKNMKNKTYHAKGMYRHFNGSTYYSLFDNKGNWYGYLNQNAATIAPGKQGIWLSKNQKGIVSKKNYDVWENFNWKKKGTTNSMYGKEYQIKGYYNHFNGSTYYSLYDKAGKWQGYVNSNAVDFSRRVSTFLETSEEKVLAHLKSHESDGFYLGTPYRGVLASPDQNYVMSPRGRPNGYGAGMNCAGFVAYAYREGGANLNKITQISNQWGGAGNAYNWRNALTRNTDYSTFNSIDGLLASGKAKKGDIIYFEPNYFLPGPDPHIGIFWGNSSSHNRFFHCTVPSIKISHIYSGTPFSKVYLFPL